MSRLRTYAMDERMTPELLSMFCLCGTPCSFWSSTATERVDLLRRAFLPASVVTARAAETLVGRVLSTAGAAQPSPRAPEGAS